METMQIGTGIQLRHVKTPKFQTRVLILLFRTPLARENATARALLPGVLRRGCVAYPNAHTIRRQAEAMYGAVFDASVVKKGEEQLLQFFLETPAAVPLAEAVRFLCDVALRPLLADGLFCEGYVTAERDVLRRVVENRVNDKRAYARLRCVEEMCVGEPFGVYGDGYAEDLERFDNAALPAVYADMVAHAPVEWLSVGNDAAAEVGDAITRQMHNVRGNIAMVPVAQYEKNVRTARRVAEYADVAQDKLCIGIRANVAPRGQAYYDLLVANMIFGGGADSKLFAAVRERESLCYYVHSFLYRFKSILLIESGVQPQDFEKAVRLIQAQFMQMQNGDFTVDALQKAKNALVKHMCAVMDEPSALLDFWLAQAVARDDGGQDDAMESIRAVTMAGCCGALQNAVLDVTYRLTAEGGAHEN